MGGRWQRGGGRFWRENTGARPPWWEVPVLWRWHESEHVSAATLPTASKENTYDAFTSAVEVRWNTCSWYEVQSIVQRQSYTRQHIVLGPLKMKLMWHPFSAPEELTAKWTTSWSQRKLPKAWQLLWDQPRWKWGRQLIRLTPNSGQDPVLF